MALKPGFEKVAVQWKRKRTNATPGWWDCDERPEAWSPVGGDTPPPGEGGAGHTRAGGGAR